MKELTPTEKLKQAIKIANLTPAQRHTMLAFIDMGATVDPDMINIIWFNGHCIRVLEDGEVDEL
jgi:hypothetical protein